MGTAQGNIIGRSLLGEKAVRGAGAWTSFSPSAPIVASLVCYVAAALGCVYALVAA